ncbi:LysR family transcriptional regulator [Streptomyces sp. NPDC001985]|uniref:LysR family transcriptional regulator n=1 Tax=Streptomyces sp. NPDC001985 TaxID=3154406 RepID=UPI003317470F
MGEFVTYDLAIYQLTSFREVARLGSLTKAARSLGYAQSSITSHIRSLESRVGLQLIQRMPHGVRLTSAGEIFHDHVVRIFHVMDEMASDLSPTGEMKGRASVGASALLLESRVGSLIRECRYRYPQVQVSPRQLAISRAEEKVRAGEVDVALVHGDCWTDGAPPSGLVVEELPPLEVAPVGAAALAAELDRTGALSTPRVLMVDPDCASHQVLVEALRTRYGADPLTIEAGSVGGARELARSGYGIAMLPAESVRSEEGYGLAVIPGLPRMQLGVWALWAGRERAMPAVAAVCDVAMRIGREPAGQPA